MTHGDALGCVLVMHPEEAFCDAVVQRLEDTLAVYCCHHIAAAKRLFNRFRIDVALLDRRLLDVGDADGMSFFRMDTHCVTAILDENPSVSQAIAAMRAHASEYFSAPLDLTAITSWVRKTQVRRRLLRVAEQGLCNQSEGGGFARIQGDSLAIRMVRHVGERIKDLPSHVLIQGETGTGKVAMARAIHEESARCDQPLLFFDARNHEGQHLAQRLFGTHQDEAGFLSHAGAGTLVLKEVGDLPLPAQCKLLNLLEDGQYYPVGSATPQPCRHRIIATTHRNLADLVEKGLFREDLYYRLCVFDIKMPTLAECPDDIERLAHYFLRKYVRQYDRDVTGFAKGVISQLASYTWPGNMRELANVIERAVVLASGGEIDTTCLPTIITQGQEKTCQLGCPLAPQTMVEPPSLRELESRYVQCVVQKLDGNKSRAANVLNISRTTLRDKLS